jgi:hypothetical protein
LALEEDPVGHEPGQQRSLREQDRGKCLDALRQKSKAAGPVGMGSGKPEIEAGDLPHHPVPDQQTTDPAQENELEHGDADQRQPVARQCQAGAVTGGDGIPGGLRQGDCAPPGPLAHRIDEHDQNQFESDRVAELHGGIDRGVESVELAGWDQVALEEFTDHDLQTLVDQQFRGDQRGQADQEADVVLDIEQKRNLQSTSERGALDA